MHRLYVKIYQLSCLEYTVVKTPVTVKSRNSYSELQLEETASKYPLPRNNISVTEAKIPMNWRWCDFQSSKIILPIA